MKKSFNQILKLTALASVVGMPAAALAGTVSLSLNSYSFGSGGEAAGELSANNGQSLSQLQALGYSSSTLDINNSPSFETFCVQNAVNVSAGVSYNYITAQSTGPSAVEGNIALSEGAAFLYYEFATGNLAGYDYANNQPTHSRYSDAGNLQSAIWYFMGETATIPGGWPSPTSGDPFVTLAETILGGANNALANNGLGGTNYNVSIMQLGSGSSQYQNQLILGGNLGGNGGQHVPDGGITVVLLGLGLAGLFWIQYQRNKSVYKQN